MDTFRIWRGDANGGEFRDYTTEVSEGMVVLDAVHRIQATQANDLACRWNCKAGKCGSCSAEINGIPKLMCMTRLNTLPLEKPVTVEPMKAFPLLKDLVTDVSWNFRVKKRIKKFKPRPPDAPDGTWRMAQADIDRVQLVFREAVSGRGFVKRQRRPGFSVPQVADVSVDQLADAPSVLLQRRHFILREVAFVVTNIQVVDQFLQ